MHRDLHQVLPHFVVIVLDIPVPPFTRYPLVSPSLCWLQALFVAADLATANRAMLLAVAAVLHAQLATGADTRAPPLTAGLYAAACLLAAGLAHAHVLTMLYP
ncbi:hypothetical protein H9P43_006711 [Blastocladiella emersonii ATCC 22665]|nr:hypothetical protein H9P43_006711 [Blastocladiella emersonii ATCC 22665]